MLNASNEPHPLLSENDFPATMVLNRTSLSPFVFCCDHAGAEIPDSLGRLGVSEENLNDHIAIDVGVFATTSWLAGSLEAPLVAQPYSRLVIDCNRLPDTPTSIRTLYDGRGIPGNEGLSATDRSKRVDEILSPYQAEVAQVLTTAQNRLGKAPILVAMHSFARLYGGGRRECDIGIIYGGDQPFASFLQEELMHLTGSRVMHNKPYEIDFEGDYTLPKHTQNGSVPYVEIEICQDLISTCAGQRGIARVLRKAFLTSEARYGAL